MKQFGKHNKTKHLPYGYTGKNGYDSEDKLNIIVNKKKTRRDNKKK